MSVIALSQDKELTFNKLDELWKNAEIPVLDTAHKKYFLFSDVHLRDGGEADDFHKNQETLDTAKAF